MCAKPQVGAAVSIAPEVSVIVPHYRDLRALDRCLQLIEGQSFPRNDFEIVVADNGTPERAELEALVRGRGRLVFVGDRGAGPARNGGAAVARGRILAFTDSDCQPEPGWLAAGVSALAHYDFVGGHVKVLVADPKQLTATESFERVFAFDFKTYITRKGFTGAGNLFCPRSVFERVGGFRAGVSEDVDWSRRARALGYRLGYEPRAIVGHPARRSWEELTGKWRRVNRETYHLSAAKFGGNVLWLLRTCLLPASAVAHSPRVLLSRELDGSAQRLAALCVLYRIRLWRFRDSLRVLATRGSN